ncbi:MAG: hypothetical protein SF187_20805 [Deltaproteobacteria bacterium]|nr:hypothetical protein [Deltaproteobacteria bacterium]
MRCSTPSVAPRVCLATALLAICLACSSRAQAQGPACIKAYEEVQVRRRESQFIAARDAAVTCASGCPAVLAKDCATWIGELEAAIPRVMLEARDGNGTPLVDVQVTIDGKPRVQQLQGRAIEVDPGPRTFVFSTKGAGDVRVQTVVVEFEKNQRVSAQFMDLYPTARHTPIPTSTWVFAGVSAIGLGTAAVFGTMAWSLRQDLEDKACAPDCPGTDVARLGRLTTVTDVSLGVGLTAAVGAVAIWLATRPAPRPPRQNLSLRSPWAPTMFAHPAAGGGKVGAAWVW